MDRKKILAWVLCAAMLLTLGLSGCGKDKDPNSTPSGDPSAPSSSVVGPSGSDVSDPTDPTATGDGTQGSSDATRPNSSSDKTTAGGNKTTAGGNKTTSANNNNDNNKPSNDTDAIGKTGYINVAELGVKGDGKTDNTGRFQEIIDALKTGGNTITFFFPAGTYLFKSTVYLPTFTNIVGEPAASGVGGATVIKAAGRMSCVFTHKDNGYFHGNVFMNLTCDGNSGKYKVDSFFYMGSVLGSSFFNMKFQNISGNGIETVKVTQNPYDWVNRFHFMEFTNVGGYAIDTTVTDTYYSDIHVKGGKGIRDTIHGGSVYRNVTVENSTGNGLSLGRSGVGEVANTVVINCTFKNNAGYGLYLADRRDRLRDVRQQERRYLCREKRRNGDPRQRPALVQSDRDRCSVDRPCGGRQRLRRGDLAVRQRPRRERQQGRLVLRRLRREVRQKRLPRAV